MAEYRSGLWKKQSPRGTRYCVGKLKIGTNEYQILLFNNDKKGNDKAPDFNLIIRLNEKIQEQPKEEIDPFKAFGDKIEFDEDIPF